MWLNIMQFILLFVIIVSSSFILNGIMFVVASKLGWFDEPLYKTHWYDKYKDRAHQWYLKKLEEQKKDGI